MLKKWLNTIQCIDCLEGLSKIDDKSIDLIITDPPYGISREINCKNQKIGTSAKLNFNFGDWDKLDIAWFNMAVKKTRGWLITFCAKKDIGLFWNILENNKFKAIDCLCWVKPDPLPFNCKSKFVNAWEAIVVGKLAGSKWNSKYQHNILRYQAPKNKSRIHPTQKPIDLIKTLIELTTNEKDIVLDPFIGSGTTAIACKMINRNYIGFEKSKEYCEAAEKRIHTFKYQEKLFK